MKRLFRVVIAVTVLLALGAAPGLAAPAETITFHYDMTPVIDPENPCVGVIGVASVNAVFHETVNGNGAHFTITETGDVVGETSGGDPVVAHYTFWVGANFNAKTGSFHGVVTLSAKGTVDGEPFMFNLRDKFDNTGGTVTYNCHDGNGPQSFDY